MPQLYEQVGSDEQQDAFQDGTFIRIPSDNPLREAVKNLIDAIGSGSEEEARARDAAIAELKAFGELSIHFINATRAVTSELNKTNAVCGSIIQAISGKDEIEFDERVPPKDSAQKRLDKIHFRGIR